MHFQDEKDKINFRINEKKISVIIPVYNVAQYLPRCLDSVINNTYKNLEIICVNDGSTDNSLELLRTYEKKDDRITVITKDNGGLSSARNAGLVRATGELVAFIDSDDWIHLQYFEILANVQKQKDYDLVLCDYHRTKDDSVLEDRICKFNLKELNGKEYLASSTTKNAVWRRLYKKDLIQEKFFDTDEKIEDALYNFEILINHLDARIASIDSKLYAYFQRENSLVTYFEPSYFFKLAAKYFEFAKVQKDKEVKEILCTEALKRSLSARYQSAIYGDRDTKKNSDLLAKKCLKFSVPRKIEYWIFVYVPIVYRLFRIIDDPTLLQWERNIRKSKRES